MTGSKEGKDSTVRHGPSGRVSLDKRKRYVELHGMCKRLEIRPGNPTGPNCFPRSLIAGRPAGRAVYVHLGLPSGTRT